MRASRALALAFDQWYPRPLESAACDLPVGAFHDAGSDWQSELPVEVVAHSVRVGLVGTDANGDGFGPFAVRLQSGDDLSDPPGAQLLIDPAHPQLLFAFVRRQRLHGRGRGCQSMEQVEDEDHCPSGENRLAGGSDPRRSVGEHRHHLGLEQAVLEPELPQVIAELRGPAARRLRAVDTDAGRTDVFVLPRLPDLRIPAVGRDASYILRLAGLRRVVRLLVTLARDHRNSSAVDPQQTRSASIPSRSNACISSPVFTTWSRRVAFDTSTPARYFSLRPASAQLSELAASA